MHWECKYCEFTCEKRGYLLKHYRLKHGNYGRTVQFPCLHKECLCTFNSINVLKVHLTKICQKIQDAQLSEAGKVIFHCQFCDFSAQKQFFSLIRNLKNNHILNQNGNIG